ncbi:sensor histidine kinase [Aureliella helgolandensis]|nr:HAMP domain-containing sensor histidine kinase [Aureliella helgolandensis]
MKLAAKLILLFLWGVLAIVAIFTWQTVRRQSQWEDHRRVLHASELVEAIKPAVEQAIRSGGTITIQQAIEYSTRGVNGPQLRWLEESTQVTVTNDRATQTAYAYIPLSIDGQQTGTIEVATPLSDEDEHLRDSIQASLLSLLGVAALSAMVIFFGGVLWVGRPLDKLVDQVELIGEGQLPQAPALSSNDELGRLAGAISLMSHRLNDQRNAIRHTDRLGTIGTLAAGIAHELGTPLNVVSGRAGLIASGRLSSEEVASSAQTIKTEAERMTHIIRQLLDFARQSPTPHNSMDIGEVLGRTCELMRPLAEASKVRIVYQPVAAPLTIDGNATQIQQVITNLISNAIAAMPSGGTVTIAVQDTPDDAINIRVSDTGLGMDPKEVDRVFEPFFTTKDVGQGTGLGLSIAYGIVREHGGQIQVESQLQVGSTFTVVLPHHQHS